MKDSKEKTRVLQKQHMGQQVIAEVIKGMMAGQHKGQQPQMTTGTGPTVKEADKFNGTFQNFPTGSSPHEVPVLGQLARGHLTRHFSQFRFIQDR